MLLRSIMYFLNSMVCLNKKDEDEKIRLVDDAFSKICLMINDCSIEVKVCASNLLVIFCNYF